MSKVNWISTGQGGCDAHCIEHPCGPCLFPGVTESEYLRAELSRLTEHLRIAREALGKVAQHKLDSIDKVYLIQNCEAFQEIARAALLRMGEGK